MSVVFKTIGVPWSQKEQRFFCLGVIFLLFFLGFGPGIVFAEEPIVLKVSHFGPSNWSVQSQILEPWAKKIEVLSQGRVKFVFFPQEILGKANEQYDLVLNGVADIACSITEYTPGRFPLISYVKLPFISGEAEKASMILWYLYQKYLKNEFKDTVVLALFCHGPANIHTISKQIKTLDDLKGLKIRVGDVLVGRVMELLGAVPVMSSAPEGYKLLKEGKVDGACIPWEGALNFNYLDLCKSHTEVNLYSLPFFIVMNKKRYNSLPADTRKIINDNSGEEMSVFAGRMMDAEDIKGSLIAMKRGDFIYHLPLAEVARWKKIAMPVGDNWVEEMKAKGLPGAEILAYEINLLLQLKDK